MMDNAQTPDFVPGSIYTPFYPYMIIKISDPFIYCSRFRSYSEVQVWIRSELNRYCTTHTRKTTGTGFLLIDNLDPRSSIRYIFLRTNR